MAQAPAKPRSTAAITQEMIDVTALCLLTKLELAALRAKQHAKVAENRAALDLLAFEIRTIASEWEAEMKERSNAP